MTISYSSGTHTYPVGTAIISLSPSVTGGPPSSAGQTTTTFAGNGTAGFINGTGQNAYFGLPLAVATDAANNVYVADADGDAIRKITPAGVVTTLAGNGTAGSVDNIGAAASFSHPAGLAIDAAGNVFVADQLNNKIRKITLSGSVTTFAGNGSAGSVDGTTNASFNNPTGVCFDNSGNLLVADYNNNKIRKITQAGVVSTLAGNGNAGAVNGPALSATFRNPMSLTVDASGNIYIADRLNHVIRKLTTTGVVSTFAGNGSAGSTNSATGTSASFNTPTNLKADPAGNLFVADQGNNLIRKITPAGAVTTLAGALTAGLVNGTGAVVRFSTPYGVGLDNKGGIYVAEAGSYVIRRIVTKAYTITPDLPAGLTFNNATGAISGTPTVASPLITYSVTAYNTTNTASSTVSVAVTSPNSISPSMDKNFIQTLSPRIAGVKTETDLYGAAADKNSAQAAISYFDGLGRAIQSIQIKGSFVGKDVVQAVTYDEFGREATKYLPYAVTTGSGAYNADALTPNLGVFKFYNPTWAGTSGSQQTNGSGIVVIPNPYAVTLFEPSPLNRPVEQGAPGTPWQPVAGGAGHTVKLFYSNNNITPWSGTGADTSNSTLAALYSVTINTDQSRTLTRAAGAAGNYAANQLYITISKDENWKVTGLGNSRGGTTEEYKDKNGRVVLKRTFNYKPAQTSPVTPASLQVLSTYYVYDEIGNLAFVLLPGANPDAGLTSAANQTVLDNLCYQYQYDERNRLVQKRLPGKGWEYIIYNKLDQPVLTQDANQRLSSLVSNQWKVTKYDALGRVIMTGLWNAGSLISRSTLQNSIYAAAQWDIRNTADNVTGYTVSSYPALSKILSINYYDNYTNVPLLPVLYSPTAGTYITNPTGLPTATKIAVLNTITNASPDYLLSASYYDDQGRIIKTYKQHYLGGSTPSPYNYDELSNTYNFTNQVKTTTRKHYVKPATGTVPTLAVTIANTYDYDHMGRKINTFEQIITPANTGTNVLLAKNEYNEIGQLKTKYLHSATGAAPFLQNIDYAYNERGWLSKINDPAVAPTAAKVFGMALNYNSGTTPQYTGNISSISWLTKVPAGLGLSQTLQSFAYTYDQLNRLKLANYTTAGALNKFDEELTYDPNGNILTLKRKNVTTTGTYLNNFTYDYTTSGFGNKLWGVADAGTASQGGTYTYDDNGNAKTDSRNQITGTTFNVLNLPQVVTRTPGNVTYTYDATGAKLRKVSGSISRDYISGIEYNNGVIESVTTEEGRATSSSGVYSYEYYLKDHLGNMRAMVRQDGSIGQVQDYYAFGMNMASGNTYVPSPNNKYKFNGKEIQDETGQYDYGARFYDPVIARWTSVDPLAEKNRRFSVYVYGKNNPIIFIDPDGMKDVYFNDKTENHTGRSRTEYLINQGLGGAYANIDEKTGLLSIGVSSKQLKQMNREQKAFYDVLKAGIDNESLDPTRINLVDNDTKAFIGDYDTNKIDIGDVEHFGSGEQATGADMFSVFGHEYTEQVAKNSFESKGFYDDHEKGKIAEGTIKGVKRIANDLRGLNEDKAGGQSGIYTITYIDNGSKVTTVITVDVRQNNIDSITRRP